MIHDSETNFLYLADSLKKKKYAHFLTCFETALDANNIPYQFLSETNDIWIIDYMPVQINDNKFVQFEYNPDYLQSKSGLKTISDVENICKSIKLIPKKSTLVVDGGNITQNGNAVIMCDKVFKENANLSEKELIKQLKDTLEIEKLYFVPWDKYDVTGHADGMVRSIDDKTVLINDYSKEKPEFQRAFRMALYNAGLDWIELPYKPYENKPSTSAEGIYLNYLQMKQAIFVPIFKRNSDDIALRILEKVFKGENIVPIESNEVAKEGGILNCVTWNVKGWI